MPAGLNTSLMIAMQSLLAQQSALNVTTNNIANVNTPGYSREIPVFSEASPTAYANYTSGNGVVFQGFQSVRDQVLELRIQQVTQQNSGAQAQVDALQQIEPLFSNSGADIGSRMTAFFNSVAQLQPDPSNSALRQSVLTAGQNLANAFNSSSAEITQLQSSLNNQVTQDVQQINDLSRQIADLNVRLSSLKSAGQDGGSTQDEMNVLLGKLSQLADMKVTQTDSGLTITTANGSPLVVGSKSFALQTTDGANGSVQVLDSTGKDITASLRGGALGGVLQVRDTVLTGVLNELDTLANEFGNAFNAAHEAGSDLNGNSGSAFFNVSSTVAGSAAGLKVLITDPKLVAASSDGSAGSNGNLANLIGVRDGKLASGTTPVAAYSRIVFDFGSATAGAKANADATASTLQQLNDQRSSISGVSINEESANLIRFQQAFQAAAKVISTISDLNNDIMNMIR